jgi:hypothetical protein
LGQSTVYQIVFMNFLLQAPFPASTCIECSEFRAARPSTNR